MGFGQWWLDRWNRVDQHTAYQNEIDRLEYERRYRPTLRVIVEDRRSGIGDFLKKLWPFGKKKKNPFGF